MELLDYEAIDSSQLLLKHPFSMTIAGSRRTGKTYFVKTLLLLKDTFISPPIDKVFWFYAAKQEDVFSELRKTLGSSIKFICGLPQNETIKKSYIDNQAGRSLIILDDLMDETGKREDVKQLFTRGRHEDISVVLITQNYTHKGKEVREINLNSDYTVMFKNPRDETLPRTLGTQMGNYKFLIDAYRQATRNPFSYLFLDSRSDTDDSLRYRSEIFSKNPNVYAPLV